LFSCVCQLLINEYDDDDDDDDDLDDDDDDDDDLICVLTNTSDVARPRNVRLWTHHLATVYYAVTTTADVFTFISAVTLLSYLTLYSA